ncbi:DUF742 domain-containing protein [Streptomyces sp. NPDC017435]|uniref:DUF742 domain-containing protein n=1 Tax=Streptomyces sp. NPDC017435 TaxID=3364995 RepID=UPI0037B296E9
MCVASVTVLVSDLIDAGSLTVSAPDRADGEGPDTQMLQAFSADLRRKWPHAAAMAGWLP